MIQILNAWLRPESRFFRDTDTVGTAKLADIDTGGTVRLVDTDTGGTARLADTARLAFHLVFDLGNFMLNLVILHCLFALLVF